MEVPDETPTGKPCKWIELGLITEAPQEKGVRRVYITSVLRLRPFVAMIQELRRPTRHSDTAYCAMNRPGWDSSASSRLNF